MVKPQKPAPLLGTLSQWTAIAICAALGFGVFAFVDLTPEIQADFFFSTDDPQLQNSLQIEREFGGTQQILVAARSEQLVTRDYLQRLRALTEALHQIEGVEASSLTRGPQERSQEEELDPAEVFEDLSERPFSERLLLASDRSATFVVLSLEGKDHDATVSAIDEVVSRHTAPGFEIGVSGVPYVSEHVRRQLTDDLRRFSIGAFGAFAVVVGVLFRSLAVLLGVMVAALSAAFATFVARALIGMPTDILAPNLWIIAAVLTLSHVVYLTAEWRSRAHESGEQAMQESIRLTAPASGWSLAANVLGFTSLIFYSAKPLQQFGISGAIAATLAMACAYGLYPPFLRAADPGQRKADPATTRLGRFFTTRHPWIAMAVIISGLALAPFAWYVDTDPALPSYFSVGSRIHTGLESIDRAGGSSPLDIVVTDAQRRPLDDDEVVARLGALQRRLEEHPEVGSVLSVALLMEEAERPWYSNLLPWEVIFERLESRDHGEVGRYFVSEDRRRGRFILQMRELERARPREVIIGEIDGIVRKSGFTPVLVGGLYPLANEMSELVEGSVIRGLGGLLGLFFVIVLIVTRSLGSALAMALCLGVTPLLLFGLVSLRGMPVDIISAPAANVALPLGVDEMIHLGYAIRRQRGRKRAGWAAWQETLSRMWRPIFVSMLIVVSGFSLFLLSNFPPTQRLGILVCIGAAMTDLVVLIVLPAVATWSPRRRRDS